MIFKQLPNECAEEELAESVRAVLCQQELQPVVMALAAVALISLVPAVVAMGVPTPDTSREAAQPLLLCFATGGMLGDVFLHILPGTLGGGHEHGHDHGHHEHHDHGHHDHGAHGHGGGSEHHDHAHGNVTGSLLVLGGFIAFFLVEKLVRHFNGGHSHDHSHGHDDPASNGAAAAAEPPAQLARRAKSPKRESPSQPRRRKRATKTDNPVPAAAAGAELAEIATRKGESIERRIGGYLNLAADAAHNFTDGLMIGAAFASSGSGKDQRWATTLAVLVHEVPHEVGDVAVLMQAGWGKRAAIKTQLLTALGAALGAVIGVMTGETKADHLLNFTAGGFVYVATVDVLPQLLRECSAWQTCKEVLAMCCGISLMVVVMEFE